MIPKLKPVRGWQYRVIVCTENGNYKFDDVHDREQVSETARLLVSLLPVEKDNERTGKRFYRIHVHDHMKKEEGHG